MCLNGFGDTEQGCSCQGMRSCCCRGVKLLLLSGMEESSDARSMWTLAHGLSKAHRAFPGRGSLVVLLKLEKEAGWLWFQQEHLCIINMDGHQVAWGLIAGHKTPQGLIGVWHWDDWPLLYSPFASLNESISVRSTRKETSFDILKSVPLQEGHMAKQTGCIVILCLHLSPRTTSPDASSPAETDFYQLIRHQSPLYQIRGQARIRWSSSST